MNQTRPSPINSVIAAIEDANLPPFKAAELQKLAIGIEFWDNGGTETDLEAAKQHQWASDVASSAIFVRTQSLTWDDLLEQIASASQETETP